MAAMMMFMAMEDDDKKDKEVILAYHKKESLIRKNMSLHLKNNSNVIHYGVMWYSTYYIRGINITDYKILFTNHDINKINDCLDIIIKRPHKYDMHYLIYSVKNIDPNLVSYDIITSSTYSHVTMKVYEKNSSTLATITGDRLLRNTIFVPCLTNYNNYANQLRGMKKSEVKKLLNGWCLVYTKNNIIRLILINEKRNLC